MSKFEVKTGAAAIEVLGITNYAELQEKWFAKIVNVPKINGKGGDKIMGLYNVTDETKELYDTMKKTMAVALVENGRRHPVIWLQLENADIVELEPGCDSAIIDQHFGVIIEKSDTWED